MKFLKTLTVGTALLAILLIPVSVIHADELAQVATPDPATSATTTVVVDANQAQLDELASLQAREQDPDTGIFMKIFLKFKINQLKNQLTIKKALQ